MYAALLPLLLLPRLAWAEENGILKVKSNVAGADVYVDGALLGDVPITQYLPVGSHQVRVVADNYDPVVRKVEVQADRTTDLNATLQAGKGTVEFTGPPGAVLTLDGTERGPLPMRLRDLSPGSHSFRVEAPLHEPTEGNVDFIAGKNLLLDVALPSSRGIFLFESTPPGATVNLDGAQRGVTPLRLEEVEPGAHVVALSLDDHATVFRTVDTSLGQRGEVKATLPSSGGVLFIDTGDDAAVVKIAGIPMGTGEKVEIGPLEKGRTRVVVEADGEVVDQNISIPSSGRVAYKVDGDELVELQPLVKRWTFWALVGGGVAVAGATTAAVMVASEPPEPPIGDTVVELP